MSGDDERRSPSEDGEVSADELDRRDDDEAVDDRDVRVDGASAIRLGSTSAAQSKTSEVHGKKLLTSAAGVRCGSGVGRGVGRSNDIDNDRGMCSGVMIGVESDDESDVDSGICSGSGCDCDC